MATRTVYVKDTDTWEQAVNIANRLDISMSELIARAIKSYNDRHDLDDIRCPVCERVHEMTRK